jgi:hypothetical protein
MTSPSVAEANANAAPDLGVLFVHGIGHQTAGETMVQFGDPLLRWLQEWLVVGFRLTRDEAAETKEEFAGLKWGWLDVIEAQVRTQGVAPAHSDVEIGVTSDNNGQPRRWILAESCWADAFVPPTFKALAFWGLVIYPWTNATHYGSRMRRQWSRACSREGRLPRAIAIAKALIVIAFLLIISVPISIFVVALLAALLVLAIPPIPTLRTMLLRVQQSLADTLGDCFILVASPIQKAAIVSHVRRDLEWLISRDCKNIAIVAHSQGAAVAFHALCTGVLKRLCEAGTADCGSPAPVFRKTMLITFGSGLKKLHELESALLKDRAQIGWMPIGGLALIALSLEFFNVINLLTLLGPSLGLGSLCAFFGISLWVGGVRLGAEERPLPDHFDPRTRFDCDKAGEMKWHDYYASHDPVPNGPLFEKEEPFLESEEVHNFASMWRDHTTYWLNRDEFIPAIIRDLAQLSQLSLLELRPDDAKLIRAAAARRASRVRWLARARSALFVTGIVVMITRWASLPRIGDMALSELPLLEKALGWFGIKNVSNGEFATNLLSQKLVGIVVVFIGAAVAYQIAQVFWHIWTWQDTRALLRRQSYGSDAPRWLFLIAVLVLVNLGIFISLGLPTTNVAPMPNPATDWIVLLVIPGVGAFGLMSFWRLFRRPKVASATFGPAATAMLLLSPIMALSLAINMDVGYRIGILIGLVALGCFLIRFFSVVVEDKRDADVRPNQGA